MSYLSVVEHKIDIASKLNNGEIGGSYYEAMMIISSIISATASLLWPGEQIDRKRFIELLISYNTTAYNFSKISIPLLNESSFLSREHYKQILKEYKTISYGMILIDSDIDKEENYILSICEGIDIIKLRKYSYANLFYKEIRSSLVHEYSLSKKTHSKSMTKRDCFVSYYNNAYDYPYRRIVFHFGQIKELVWNIAKNAYNDIKNGESELPQSWWIEGA